jgi:hypothetical protein
MKTLASDSGIWISYLLQKLWYSSLASHFPSPSLPGPRVRAALMYRAKSNAFTWQKAHSREQWSFLRGRFDKTRSLRRASAEGLADRVHESFI